MSSQPNVLIVVADDLGYGDVGFNGSTILTPNLDNHAFSGVRFQQMYGNPICTPTRAALMTGLYPLRYGTQGVIWPWNRHGVPAHLRFLPQAFKEAGYSTWAVGKWHLGHGDPSFLPLQRGFDHHYGNYTGAIGQFDHKAWGVPDFYEDGTPISPHGHCTDLYTAKAVKHIFNGSSPFFGYVAFNAPHIPLEDTKPFLDSYNYLRDKERAAYSAMVTHLDAGFGQIIEALRLKGQLDNTYVWFFSDNGGWVGYGGNNGPLRGGKISSYEGGVRLVSALRGPGLKPTTVCRQVIHTVDLFPTFAQLAGIVSPSGIDGRDVSAQIKGSSPEFDREIVWSLYCRDEALIGALRYGPHKLIKTKEKSEIYDVINDPTESKPLDDPALRADLVERLDFMSSVLLPDPRPVFWTQSGGPPLGFVTPLSWTTVADPTISLLSVSEDDGKDSFQELLGYPSDISQIFPE